MLRSYSERYILLRGVGSEEQKFRVTVDQQIHFTECPYKEPRGPDSFTVKFERVNAIYDQTENIVRFASQSSIFNDGEKKFEREPIIETSVGHAPDNSGGTQVKRKNIFSLEKGAHPRPSYVQDIFYSLL